MVQNIHTKKGYRPSKKIRVEGGHENAVETIKHLVNPAFDHDDVDIQQHKREHSDDSPVSCLGQCFYQSFGVAGLRSGIVLALVARGDPDRDHLWAKEFRQSMA